MKENIKLKNKVIEHKNYLDIYLELPIDLPFDIDAIIIRYKGENIEILGDEIPISIKDNICSFYAGNILKFISCIEENIETLLKGEVPNISSHPRKPRLLPDTYILPVSQKPCTEMCIISKHKNISMFTVSEVRCDVKCNKCGQVNHINGANHCKKCSLTLKLLFEPRMGVSNIAYFSVRECYLIALIPISFIIVCESCNSIYQTKGLVDNEEMSFNCYKCYCEISIAVEKLIYAKPKKIRTRDEKQDLNGDGTCKHYRKSMRWFRFPCCSRLYPCDICHDEKSDHQFEMARKMVCGMCKTEQSVSNACKCGMDLNKKNSQFWEGGKGSRNKTTMSKKDTKKYKK